MLALPVGAKLLVSRQTRHEVRYVIDLFTPSDSISADLHEAKKTRETLIRTAEHAPQNCIVDNIVDENKMNSAANSRARPRRVGVCGRASRSLHGHVVWLSSHGTRRDRVQRVSRAPLPSPNSALDRSSGFLTGSLSS